MQQTHEQAPEVKSADAVEAFDDFMRSFDAFKEANDERLARSSARWAPTR